MNTKENVLSKLSAGLKHEKVAYRIYGIVTLVLAIILIICGSFIMLTDATITTNETITMGDFAYHNAIFGSSVIDNDSNYIVLGFGGILLAYAIVNLIRSFRIGKYRLSESLTVKHASSVGSIVLSAIFNEIALVFAIINFVTSKSNRAVLAE